MTTRESYSIYWMGLDREGNDIGISHDRLMAWAAHNDYPDMESIAKHNNWIDPDGGRLVRGNHIAEARKMGWDDIADLLEEFFQSKGL